MRCCLRSIEWHKHDKAAIELGTEASIDELGQEVGIARKRLISWADPLVTDVAACLWRTRGTPVALQLVNARGAAAVDEATAPATTAAAAVVGGFAAKKSALAALWRQYGHGALATRAGRDRAGARWRAALAATTSRRHNVNPACAGVVGDVHCLQRGAAAAKRADTPGPQRRASVGRASVANNDAQRRAEPRQRQKTRHVGAHAAAAARVARIARAASLPAPHVHLGVRGTRPRRGQQRDVVVRPRAICGEVCKISAGQAGNWRWRQRRRRGSGAWRRSAALCGRRRAG